MTTNDELLLQRVQKVHGRLNDEYDGPGAFGWPPARGAAAPAGLGGRPSARTAATLMESAARVLRMTRGESGTVLGVESDHYRVALRLGLIAPEIAAAAASDVLASQLPVTWGATRVYTHHELMATHGQECCYYAAPACHRCPVLDQCPFGKARLGQGDEPQERPAAPAPRPETLRVRPGN